MTVREARVAFTLALAALVQWATKQGYEVAFAEGMDRKTVKDPTTDHMPNSLHEMGLAQDIDLYIGGKWMPLSEAHAPLGGWWEDYGKQHNLPLVWGGRFRDGNHYSLEWQGRK